MTLNSVTFGTMVDEEHGDLRIVWHFFVLVEHAVIELLDGHGRNSTRLVGQSIWQQDTGLLPQEFKRSPCVRLLLRRPMEQWRQLLRLCISDELLTAKTKVQI